MNAIMLISCYHTYHERGIIGENFVGLLIASVAQSNFFFFFNFFFFLSFLAVSFKKLPVASSTTAHSGSSGSYLFLFCIFILFILCIQFFHNRYSFFLFFYSFFCSSILNQLIVLSWNHLIIIHLLPSLVELKYTDFQLFCFFFHSY